MSRFYVYRDRKVLVRRVMMPSTFRTVREFFTSSGIWSTDEADADLFQAKQASDVRDRLPYDGLHVGRLK